jgi:ABC-type bacteriocin/lantibiotic exporter with double-glycine peptidase domain
VCTEEPRTSGASAGRLSLLGFLLVSGCYLGSARDAKLSELTIDNGWELVGNVPPVRQVAREDCGAAALAMVLGYWGRPVTRDAISATYATGPERGIKAENLRDLARRQGLQAFLIPGQQSDLVREVNGHRPVLVGLMKRYILRNYPHYEVVVGINRQKQSILTLDPAHGLRVNSHDGFATEWAKAGRLALIIFPIR